MLVIWLASLIDSFTAANASVTTFKEGYIAVADNPGLKLYFVMFSLLPYPLLQFSLRSERELKTRQNRFFSGFPLGEFEFLFVVGLQNQYETG